MVLFLSILLPCLLFIIFLTFEHRLLIILVVAFRQGFASLNCTSNWARWTVFTCISNIPNSLHYWPFWFCFTLGFMGMLLSRLCLFLSEHFNILLQILSETLFALLYILMIQFCLSLRGKSHHVPSQIIGCSMTKPTVLSSSQSKLLLALCIIWF